MSDSMNAYNRILKAMVLHEWPELLKKLAEEDVLVVVIRYLDAKEGFIEADKACKKDLTEENRAIRQMYYDWTHPTYKALLTMVYGEGYDPYWSKPYDAKVYNTNRV